MICPHIINVSVLVGGIISWGIMWPLIEDKKGQWYSEKLSSDDLSGLEGYKVIFHLKQVHYFSSKKKKKKSLLKGDLF